MSGTGNVTLSSAETYTGVTTVNAGNLILPVLEFNRSGAGGGTFNYSAAGTNSQSFTTTTIGGGGASVINNAVSTDTLNLGNLTQTAGSGGWVNFTNTGNITTTTGNSNGRLGAWATIEIGNGNSTATAVWAANGNGTGLGNVIAYTGYTNLSATASTGYTNVQLSSTANYLTAPPPGPPTVTTSPPRLPAPAM